MASCSVASILNSPEIWVAEGDVDFFSPRHHNMNVEVELCVPIPLEDVRMSMCAVCQSASTAGRTLLLC